MTKRIHYTKDKNPLVQKIPRAPLTWCHPDPVKDVFALRQGVKAYLCCSQGHATSIRTHTIEDNGMVHPSLVYPIKKNDDTDCDHVWGVLDDWSDPERNQF